VDASGPTAIWGQGLVVDSLARATDSAGAAIAADAPKGGSLRVINATAIGHDAPALLARSVRSATGPVEQNVLTVSNSIARGGPADVRATTSVVCAIGEYCAVGRVAIDHSNFVVRDPAPGAPGASAVAEGAGKQSTDPLFAGTGDYHLRAGSPAIDAGAPLAPAAPADLDGRPRPQGGALDLGAYETPAPGVGGAGSGAAGRSIDRTAPVLGRLRLTHSRFRARTKLTTTISEASRLRLAVERRATGRRGHGRCVARATAKKAARCTRWVPRGVALTRAAAGPGRVTLAFNGRVNGRRLAPGRYRFVLEASDAAGNRTVRRATFTVVGAA